MFKQVSIPFKRESVYKEGIAMSTQSKPSKVSIPFKRESVYKGQGLAIQGEGQHVSIPFKRESVYKEKSGCFLICRRFPKFQFPSNGKAYTKGTTIKSIFPAVILFQFPSNGKAYTKYIHNYRQ